MVMGIGKVETAPDPIGNEKKGISFRISSEYFEPAIDRNRVLRNYVSVWGKQAEKAAGLKVGDLVAIHGTLSIRKRDQEGQKAESRSIIAQAIYAADPAMPQYLTAIISGRVGGDPKTGTSNQGSQWASFSIATSRWDDRAKDYKSIWHSIRVFGDLVPPTLDEIFKGTLCCIEGTPYWSRDSRDEKVWHPIVIANAIFGCGRLSPIAAPT